MRVIHTRWRVHTASRLVEAREAGVHNVAGPAAKHEQVEVARSVARVNRDDARAERMVYRGGRGCDDGDGTTERGEGDDDGDGDGADRGCAKGHAGAQP